jgi:hypothetical protein
MTERIAPILTTLVLLVALSLSQPYIVVAVECFAGPARTVMVSQHHGPDARDVARAGGYTPLFGRRIRSISSNEAESPSPPVALSPSGLRSSRKRGTVSRRTSTTGTATALHSWRGGGGGVEGGLLFFPLSHLRKLPAFVAQSKTRCIITLCVSILGECLSTSLNKYSKVHGSPKALVAAMALYLMT